jgi:RNA-binding protein
VPSPINPRKQSLMPSGKLRKALRAAGHHRPVVVQVGKEGVTEPLLRQLEEALLAHELVKVKVGTECPEDRFEVGAIFAAEPGVQLAQILGRTLLVYRKHPQRPRFEPGAPVAAARAGRPVPGRKAPAQRGRTRPGRRS